MIKNPVLEARVITAEFQSQLKSFLSYMAVVADDQFNVKMLGWSFGSMAQCNMDEKPIDYNLGMMGVWGDAMREKKVIIINDYAACTRPTKHGYPKGHVEVKRHMNGPVIHEGKVIALIGVGNKITEYDDQDVKTFNQLVEKHKAKILELKKSTF